MSVLYPMLIQPRYVERIWGGHNLATRLGKPAPRDQTIGESWEVYEENQVLNGAYAGQTIGQLRATLGRDLMGHIPPDQLFPLLTKLIDAQQTLSVQVHPDDHFAQLLEGQPNGKTECWYVLQAEPDARLTYGFARDSTPAEYTALVQAGDLDALLRALPVRAGDVVYLPAGMVHAIGAGIVLYELQQTSDVTYRIYDWNRRDAAGKARELHVEKARRVLDYHRCTRGAIQPLQLPGSGRAILIASPYFCLELLEAGSAREVSAHESVVAVCALDQPVAVEIAGAEAVMLPAYSSLLIPAAAGRYTLRPSPGGATAHALAAYVPVSDAATRADLANNGVPDTEIDAFLAQFAPARDLGEPATAAS